MTALDRYFASATATLAEVAATQGETLEAAARLVADSVADGGVRADAGPRRHRPGGRGPATR